MENIFKNIFLFSIHFSISVYDKKLKRNKNKKGHLRNWQMSQRNENYLSSISSIKANSCFLLKKKYFYDFRTSDDKQTTYFSLQKIK